MTTNLLTSASSTRHHHTAARFGDSDTQEIQERAATALVTKGMEKAVVTIPRLIAVGASEHDLVEILSNDPTKSDALMPLTIALRQRMGVEVRAPTEMLEVAEDIRKQIDKITATGAPAARASSSSGT